MLFSFFSDIYEYVDAWDETDDKRNNPTGHMTYVELSDCQGKIVHKWIKFSDVSRS